MIDQPERDASLLLITRDELFGRALDTVFAPSGFKVTRASSQNDAISRARNQPPDAIVLHAQMMDPADPTTWGWLREIPEIGRRTPLVVASTTRLTAAERRAALRAGAWHLVEAPFNSEQLMLQLDVFLAVKRETDRYRDAAFLDPISGLYTPKGIQHRAVELAALAARAHEPLACVVFSPATSAEARNAVLEAIIQVLRDLGRRSDAIGSLGDSQFVVVAPATPAPGAELLAERFANGVRDDLRRQLRAGFDVAETVDQPTLVAPRLIDHARRAASDAMNDNGKWIQEYRGD